MGRLEIFRNMGNVGNVGDVRVVGRLEMLERTLERTLDSLYLRSSLSKSSHLSVIIPIRITLIRIVR